MFSHAGLFQEHKIIHPQQGFLFSDNSLKHFPVESELNSELYNIAINLPLLLTIQHLRNKIDQLNKTYFSSAITLEKGNYHQKQTALFLLLMLAQAYVWENPEQPANTLPAVIAKNLYKLCKSQQRFLALTYADYILNNWTLKEPDKEISLDNIEPILTFTGTQDEAWFIKIHIAIEAVCAPALQAVYQAYSLAAGIKAQDLVLDKNNEELLCASLKKISQPLKEAVGLLKRMKEGCRPEYFWTSLRPLFNGWELIKTKQQEREETGVKLEGIEIADKRLTYSYRGPSGAQSSIIPALDAALGVKHDINNMYQTLLTFQQYMPNEHQSFINLLHTSSIKKVVKASQSNALHTAWKQAVDSLKLFRLAHLGLVSQYLYKPAVRQGMAENQLIGTGGTPITDYLASRHESTQVRAKL